MSEPKKGSPTLKETQRILRERLPELKKRYGVRSLGLFGPYVRGEKSRHSDRDILVEFVRLEAYLSQLVGPRVDLVMKSALKPRIGERILSETIPL